MRRLNTSCCLTRANAPTSIARSSHTLRLHSHYGTAMHIAVLIACQYGIAVSPRCFRLCQEGPVRLTAPWLIQAQAEHLNRKSCCTLSKRVDAESHTEGCFLGDVSSLVCPGWGGWPAGQDPSGRMSTTLHWQPPLRPLLLRPPMKVTHPSPCTDRCLGK